MARARAGFALAASLMIAGCSLLTDLSGLSEPAVGDGGGLVVTAADAMTDATAAPDGDAAALVDGAAPSSDCTASHFFCTDFDKKALADEWDVVAPGGGTLDRSMAAAVSMPFSLLVTHPDGNPASAPVVTKTVAAPITGGGLRCRFQYRRDVVESTGVVVVLMVDFNTSGSEHLFAEIKDGQTKGRVYLAATQSDGGVLDDFPTIPTFSTSLGSWTSVDWTLDLATLRSTLKSGTTLVDQRPIPAFDVSKVTSVKLSLGLGNFVAPQSPWQVRYDDFVCDVLP